MKNRFLVICLIVGGAFNLIYSSWSSSADYEIGTVTMQNSGDNVQLGLYDYVGGSYQWTLGVYGYAGTDFLDLLMTTYKDWNKIDYMYSTASYHTFNSSSPTNSLTVKKY